MMSRTLEDLNYVNQAVLTALKSLEIISTGLRWTDAIAKKDNHLESAARKESPITSA